MVENYQWPEGVTEKRKRTMTRLIWMIQRAGGYERPDGTAGTAARDEFEKLGFSYSRPQFNQMLRAISKGGSFGEFIERDTRARNAAGRPLAKPSKRTYAIRPVRDPQRDPFPPNPFKDAPVIVDEEFDEEPDESELIEDAVLVDPDEPDEPDETQDLVRTLAARLRAEAEAEAEEVAEEVELVAAEPGGDLDVIHEMPTMSSADKILAVQSLLNEIYTDLAMEPMRRFEDYVGGQLATVDRLLEENKRLRDQVEESKRTIALLRRGMLAAGADPRSNGDLRTRS